MRRTAEWSAGRRGLGVRLCVVALALACSTDTSGLARRPPASGGGGGVAGGTGGASAGMGGQPPASGGGGSGGAPASSGGMGSVRVVHGLMDGGRLFVCLREAGGAELGGGAPLPEEGVAYGESLRVPVSWDAELDVEALLFVVAGGVVAPVCSELIEAAQPQLGGADSGARDAGAFDPVFPLEPVVPRSAGSVRFPPGLLRAGAHYALVAAGCTGLGGGEEVCGRPDPVFGSSLALALAQIASGTIASGGGRFGLQFLNASRAVSRADVVLQGQTDQESRRLAEDVAFGAVRPRDAAPANEPVGVELHVEGASASSYTEVWADMVEAGGAPVEAGSNYLLVYVGPVPGSGAGGVAPPRFVLLHGG